MLDIKAFEPSAILKPAGFGANLGMDASELAALGIGVQGGGSVLQSASALSAATSSSAMSGGAASPLSEESFASLSLLSPSLRAAASGSAAAPSSSSSLLRKSGGSPITPSPSTSGGGGGNDAARRDEVARMNAAYKAKLRKEAKGAALLREEDKKRRKAEDKVSREQAKRSAEREHRMDEAAEVWLKQIVPHWSTSGIGSSSLQKKMRELVMKVGVPPRVRGVVWPLALGNALMVTPELYEIFGQQASRARKIRVEELRLLNNAQDGKVPPPAATPEGDEALDEDGSNQGASASASSTPSRARPSSSLSSSPSFTLGKTHTFQHIDVDLTRTYPSLAFFQEECPMNAQLRHLLYTYCFPEDDHQILTERGFMFLAEVEATVAQEPSLRFASYCPRTEQISYHPAKLIINEARRQRMVEFTAKDEQRAWGESTADGGATSEDTGAPTSSGTHVSLVVTPEHDMYARWGKMDAAYKKRRAGELLAAVEQDPDLCIQMLGRAAGGVAVDIPVEQLSFASELGLSSSEQIDAFLQVYGFWMGEAGALSFDPLSSESPSVTFSPSVTEARDDVKWLVQLLNECGLIRGVDFLVVDSGSPSALQPGTIQVVSAAWVRYFRSECSQDRSTKHFASWVWSLGQRHLRLLIAALRRAGDDAEADQPRICTASARFRDELQRLCLHAGYASYFQLAAKKGSGHDAWAVHYSEHASVSEPVLHGSTEVKSTTRSGRTWCITLPPDTTSGILVARRASPPGKDGVVRQASAPLLVGNCYYRPDVGYVQGMSYLAGNLLLYLAPYEAFVAFAHLLNSPFFHVFLKMDVAGMQARYRLFEECLAEAEPDLNRHLTNEGVAADLYFMEWSMTLFCKRLPLDVVGRVWDCYLLQGEVVVYRTAVAILRVLRLQKETALLTRPFDAIMRKLNQVPLDIAEEELMHAFNDVHFSSSLKNKIRKLSHVPPVLRDD